MMSYKTFSLNISNHIAQVSFNRSEKANALNMQAWEEMQTIFEDLDKDPAVRVIVLTGEGKHFCSGIDLDLLIAQQNQDIEDEALKREGVRKFIRKLQGSISSIENCRKPVIAAIHGACIGGGVDIISACDMRYCTDDAYFTIKEVDLGIVADLGTLQRLPHIIHPGIMAELAYTGRKVSGQEAHVINLVNYSFDSRKKLINAVFGIAMMIAEKSPLVVRGIKENLIYSRDNKVEDSLKFVATYNAGMLISNDLLESFQAYLEKRKPNYKDS